MQPYLGQGSNLLASYLTLSVSRNAATVNGLVRSGCALGQARCEFRICRAFVGVQGPQQARMTDLGHVLRGCIRIRHGAMWIAMAMVVEGDSKLFSACVASPQVILPLAPHCSNHLWGIFSSRH